MTASTQPIITSTTGRPFACSPAAVLVFIVNRREQFLLLRHPHRDGWEIVNGALDAAETVLDGGLREVAEEAGPAVRVRPLGAVQIQTFHYDEQVQYMLSLSLLMAYEGGPIEPGDDMADSEVRWFTLAELMDENTKVLVPPQDHMRWTFPRALELYRLWQDQDVPLQPPLRQRPATKYARQHHRH
jgi:8-oxo-dGTP pyrophosphatase MutT (NUDIX family)